MKMMKRIWTVLAAPLVVGLLAMPLSIGALADEDVLILDAPGFIPGPPPIPGHFMPEGVDYFDGFFYVGNIPTGEISRVDPATGAVEVIVPAGSDPLQQSVFGLDMDRERGLIHIASAKFPTDINAPVQSAYLAVRAATGEIVRSIDLSDVAPNFDNPRRSNDVCFLNTPSPMGSAMGKGHLRNDNYSVFITDSNSAQIWRINPGGHVTTLAHDTRFNANPSDPVNGLQIGLNGIVCHPDNFVLAVRFGGRAFSALFRVDMDGTVHEVAVADGPGLEFEGGDGLYLDGPDAMLVVEFSSTGQSAVARLETTDGWDTATVVDRVLLPLPTDGRNGCVRGTTGVIVGDEFYVDCAFTATIVRAPF